MKVAVILFFMATALFSVAVPSKAELNNYDYTVFKGLPVLHEGRIKPLDTMARTYLKVIYGSDSPPNIEAIEWLAEIVFAPSDSMNRKIFKVRSPDVATALGLTENDERCYSYNEILAAFRNNLQTLHTILNKPIEELSLSQEQTVNLFEAVRIYEDLSHSLTLVMPYFIVQDRKIAKELGVEPGIATDYMTIRKKREILDKYTVEKASKEAKLQATILQKQIQMIESHMTSQSLAVVPPQWQDSPEQWFSFWGISFGGQSSPDSAKLLELWKNTGIAYASGNTVAWSVAVQQVSDSTFKMPLNNASKTRLQMELLFNKFAPFTIALCLYALTLLVLLAMPVFTKKQKIAWNTSLVILILAVALHGLGLLMRMIIMSRPPVSNLYESIIFVSFISALWGFIIEWRRRDNFGMMTSALLGTILLFIGRKYELEGDTMKVLVAVLDTNFWLATHVVAMTIGYASTVAGSAIGHLYLFYRVFKPQSRNIQTELYHNVRGVALVALFFSSLGTILGGIWADQSWGRFWGWDPKENGALLVVLWLAWVIHGRISGALKEIGVMMGMAAAGIVVSLAWFGVNLLNIGLHSYGFTKHVALNLASYIGFELVIIIGSYFFISRKLKVGG